MLALEPALQSLDRLGQAGDLVLRNLDRSHQGSGRGDHLRGPADFEHALLFAFGVAGHMYDFPFLPLPPSEYVRWICPE